jgi:formate/nitrite transporter FocA (FNT family)
MANAPVMTVCLAGNAGKYKMGLPIGQLLLRGFMSGVYIAVGAALATVCGAEVAKFLGAGFGKLITGAVFPVGLILTVLTGMELFTGDAMLGPLAVMMGKTGWGSVFKNFCIYRQLSWICSLGIPDVNRPLFAGQLCRSGPQRLCIERSRHRNS